MKTETSRENAEVWLAQQKLDRLAKRLSLVMGCKFFILLPCFIIPIILTCILGSFWPLTLSIPLTYLWWKYGRFDKANPKSKCPRCGYKLNLDGRDNGETTYYYLKCDQCEMESMVTGVSGNRLE